MADASYTIEIKGDNAAGVLGKLKSLFGQVAGETEGLDQSLLGLERGGLKGLISATGAATAVMATALAAVTALSAGIFALGSNALTVGAQFQQYRVQLETVTGSQQRANEVFAALKDFAATTPFELSNLTQAYSLLSSAGLRPTEELLTSLGNTAAAWGRDIIDFSGAVVGAITGEMERLKGFGIIARQEGDRVNFTFQGVTTSVARNSDAIVGYLTKIGQTKFAGGMERQAATLNGALSNLQDATDAFFDTLAQETGLITLAERAVRATSSLVDLLADGIQPTVRGFVQMGASALGAADAALESISSIGQAALGLVDKMIGAFRKIPGPVLTLFGFGQFADNLGGEAQGIIASLSAGIDRLEKKLRGGLADATEGLLDLMKDLGKEAEAALQPAGGGGGGGGEPLWKELLKAARLASKEWIETIETLDDLLDREVKLPLDTQQLLARQKEGLTLTKSTRTEEEKRAIAIQKAVQLYQENHITAETLRRVLWENRDAQAETANEAERWRSELEAAVDTLDGLGSALSRIGSAFGSSSLSNYGSLVSSGADAVSSSGSIDSYASLFGAAGAWLTLFVGIADTMTSRGGKMIFTLDEMGDSVGVIQTTMREFADSRGIIEDYLGAVDLALDELGGFTESLGQGSFRITTNGEAIVTTIRGEVVRFGQDVQAAMEFAVVDSIQNGSFLGLSPEVESAIRNSTSESLSGFLADIQLAEEISLLGTASPEVARAVRGLTDEYLRQAPIAERLTGSAERLSAQYLNDLNALRNSILGIDLDPIEQARLDAAAFNDELVRLGDLYRQRLASLQEEAGTLQDSTVSLGDFINRVNEFSDINPDWSPPDIMGSLLDQLDLLGSFDIPMYDIVTDFEQHLQFLAAANGDAFGEVSDAIRGVIDQLNLLGEAGPELRRALEIETEIDRLRQLLDGLPDPIAPEEIRRRRRGSGSRQRERDSYLSSVTDILQSELPEAAQAFLSVGDQIATLEAQIAKFGDATGEAAQALEVLRQRQRDQITSAFDEVFGPQGFASQLEAVRDRYAGLRDANERHLDTTGKLAIARWKLNAAEAEMLRQIGQQALGSLGIASIDLRQRLIGVAETVRFLRENAEDLGISLEDLDAAMRELADQTFVDVGSRMVSIFDSLGLEDTEEMASLRRNLIIVEHTLKVENMRMEIELLRAQGRLTQEQQRLLDDAFDVLDSFDPNDLFGDDDDDDGGDTRGRDGGSDYYQGRRGTIDDRLREIQRLEDLLADWTRSDLPDANREWEELQAAFQAALDTAQRLGYSTREVMDAIAARTRAYWRDQLQGIDDLRSSLTIGDLSPLSREEQLSQLRGDLNSAIQRAQGGDFSAFADVERLIPAYLEALRRQTGGTAGYAAEFTRLQGILDALIALAPPGTFGGRSGGGSGSGGGGISIGGGEDRPDGAGGVEIRDTYAAFRSAGENLADVLAPGQFSAAAQTPYLASMDRRLSEIAGELADIRRIQSGQRGDARRHHRADQTQRAGLARRSERQTTAIPYSSGVEARAQ